MSASADPAASDNRELVTFRVGEQDYCVDIMAIREIRGWTPATVLPHSPGYVLGVINLRGSVVPIVDLAARLGLPPAVPTPRHVIVIAVVGEQMVGLLVDAVSDILSVNDASIQDTPDVMAETTKEFVEGVISVDSRMLRLIALGPVLPPPATKALA
ncbi:purine-binding chemotaxis protein CheW [Tranquillimonas rosea]|uniref:Purine-binding chemotaxis protein CheW n=1 Tax=Tranquillimonas rosea TaxID=641238 RepID=A0A1H9VU55_9RHOB|nr:chemotaxis protein CheW [Tranquillimonas rosea]SES24813.1 purine-binding chemotaxis protein CheW [Tranquillimonas rosea]